MKLGWLLAGVSALCIAAIPASAQDKPFAGVTVNVITQTGAIQEPLQRRAPEFEALTGAKVNVIAVPFSDLYQKVLTDWASGTNSVDAAVFAPQWMVDYIAGGYLEDLTPRVDADPAIEQDDVGAFFRDFSEKYAGKIYMITLDGDFHMMYYRTDVLEAAGLKPPTTWDEYLEVAKAVHGQDMNGDGTPDFGSCIGKKRNQQSYWFITDVIGSMTQSKGTSQGTFFNTADMTPLVDNEAFRKALEFMSASTAFGPPDELNLDGMDPSDVAAALPTIRARCEEIGRDPASLPISVHMWWEHLKSPGQARVDRLGGFRELGVSRAMGLDKAAVDDDEALARYVEDARAAGVEVG